jgi:hypothetical protein
VKGLSMIAQRTNKCSGPWRCGGKRPLARGDTGGDDLSKGEMPSIRAFGRVQGSGPPIRECSMQYGVWSLETARCGMGRGGPPWLAVQRREVDIGHRPRGAPTLRNLPTRTTAVVCRIVRSGGPKVWKDSNRTFGGHEGCERWRGSTPPIRYKRAREPIARLVVRNTSNLHTGKLPKVDVCTKRTFGRCNTGRCRATRSCVSDAVHEFSRARSPGRYPMLSFRDPRGPQLLLMRPSSLCKGVVGQPHNDEAFS